ncbi:hypothetical protein GF312_10420 [Candidatus Poribacteria bacterium]|nr:hypothetical protein [Candidatus Poribacteria bacterium]
MIMEFEMSYHSEEAENNYHIYVDGSYYENSTGYGAVILKNNKIVDELWGSVPEDMVYKARNVSGELYAVRQVIVWCKKNSVREIDIFYDYKGVKEWVTGDWKAKQDLTREYLDFIRKSGIKIHWHKVESHTGDKWNDRADELARKGAGFNNTNNIDESELYKYAEGFVSFLLENSYNAELKGIYNSNCAKIKIELGRNSLGYLNIYNTKKEPYVLRYHELKSESYKESLETLWNEYHNGERELPL